MFYVLLVMVPECSAQSNKLKDGNYTHINDHQRRTTTPTSLSSNPLCPHLALPELTLFTSPSTRNLALTWSLLPGQPPLPRATSTTRQHASASTSTPIFESYASSNARTSRPKSPSTPSGVAPSPARASTSRIPAKNASTTARLCAASSACADISCVCRRWCTYARVYAGNAL